MPLIGCTNPHAKNYDPESTTDDGSCIYLESVGGECYQFEDVPAAELIDHSFTLSLVLDSESLQPKGWVFYHDYFPDFYIHTRNQLYNLANNRGYVNNQGPRGRYHDDTVHPFFVDVLVANKGNMILNSVNWVTEVRAGGNDEIDDNQPALFGETLTAITIWNNYQTTGRIALESGIISLDDGNNRNSEQKWNFNEFRNVLDTINEQFIKDIFHDFQMDSDKLNYDLP